MRITSGALKGRKLQTLSHADLRPTTSKIKQKVFNILEHNPNILSCDNLTEVGTMLDVCSGLGSMAFEGLSRGIQNVILIDRNRLFGELAEFNAKTLGVEDKVKFCNYNALNLPKCHNKVDLCFIDPPYKENIEHKILIELIKKEWLNNEAVVVLEAAKRAIFEIPEQYEVIDKREDGITKLFFLRFNGNSDIV